jgi:hypothetical protein
MSEQKERCEACGRVAPLRTVGAEMTGDKGARVCVDSTACQRSIVAAKRRLVEVATTHHRVTE